MKTTVLSALSDIKSGDNIFVHGGAAFPAPLIELLLKRSSELRDVTIYHLHTEGPVEYAHSRYSGIFRVRNLFVGSNMRPFLDFDRVDYIPCFLSEIPQLFRKDRIHLHHAFVQTSREDKNGLVSLGTSVDIAKAAVMSADNVIAEINARMPRTFGDGIFPASRLKASLYSDRRLPEIPQSALSEDDKRIGLHVAGLIEDGSCLQIGIGSVPGAVLSQLYSHKNLGIHSELCSDGVLPLLKSGVINNSRKKFHRGRSVCSFLLGSNQLYEFVNDNPEFFLLEADYVNNPGVIARNSKMISINSAVEVDLTGQVCADSVGRKIISGVGGQVDFIRGASLSEGGKAIVAIASRTKKGNSRIVVNLKEGAGVVTTRAHLHYVVTEYGVADLYGKSLGERAKALIAVAHPEDRDSLERQWRGFIGTSSLSKNE